VVTSLEFADRTIVFLSDIRHSTRRLARAPGFTVIVVLTLALGIAAATAMFSVVNGVLLRPLPYPEQERLIELMHQAPGLGLDTLFASPAIYFTYRNHNTTFDSVGLWDDGNSPVTVTGSGQAESVQSLEVTHEVLDILGSVPIVGRGFSEDDDRSGGQPTAVISYSYWQRHFGGANVLGQTLVADGVQRQIIGVLPEWFRFFEQPAEIFFPLQPRRTTAMFLSFSGRAIARLKAGATLEEANADVSRMIPILREEFPAPAESNFATAELRPKLRWLRDSVVGELSTTLWILMGTIGILLMIAAANVANLVLVRALAQRQDLAIRAALGASAGGIARVVLLGSALLGLAAGSIGFACAYLCVPLLLSMSTFALPQVMTVEMDHTVALFAFATSALATLSLGLVSLLRSARPNLPRALRSSGRSMTLGRDESRVRHGLLVSQVALALLLLVGSGLMIRTYQAIRNVDPGFDDPNSVQIVKLTIPEANLENPDGPVDSERLLVMQRTILDKLASVPGVDAVGFAALNDGLPLDGDGRSASIRAEGRTLPGAAAPIREIQFVSPGFFETLGTPLLAGRPLQWDDVFSGRLVVVVSENLARAEWGSAEAALGHRVGVGPTGQWFEIVGVVKDIHHNGLSEPAPESVSFPPPYRPGDARDGHCIVRASQQARRHT